jgi:hypothetical protein
VSKESNVNRGAIGRILKEQSEGVTWETVEKIAMGLEKIDPVAKIAFLGTLALPDDRWIPGIEDFKERLPIEEHPETIEKIMTIFDDLGLLNQEAIQQFKKQLPKIEFVDKPIDLEQWISIKMQQRRIEEEQTD